MLSGKRWQSLPASKRALRLSARIDASSLLAGDDCAMGEMQLGLIGDWEGHSSGSFAITEADIDSILAVFAAQKTPLTVDYNHASVPDGRAPTAEEGKASGWIRSLSKRMGENGAELWADLVEWTEEAAARIRAGEYRFCSPVFLFGSSDRVTNEEVAARIFNVALTNVPFLDGMAPVRLSETAQGASMQDEEKKPVEVPAKDPALEAAVDAVVPEEKPEEEKPVETADEAPDAQDGEAATRDGEEIVEESTATAAASIIEDLAKEASSDPATVVDALRRNFDAVAKAINEILEREKSQTSNHQTVSVSEPVAKPASEERFAAAEKKQMQREMLKLSQEVAELKKVDEARKASEKSALKASKVAASQAFADALIKSGHILEADRDDAVELHSADAARAARVYASQKVPLGTLQAGPAETVSAPSGTLLKFSDLERDARQVAETVAQIDTIKDGKRVRLSEHESCLKARETIEAQKARRVG